MNGPNEVLSRFGELEEAIKTHYGKVDPRLLVDMIFRQRGSKKDPIYTLEVFIKPNQNTDQIREMIIQRSQSQGEIRYKTRVVLLMQL